MVITELKKKLRKLKHLEAELMDDQESVDNQTLLWYSFFSFQKKSNVKYPLEFMLTIDNNEYKKIAKEYIAFIYTTFFEKVCFPTKSSFNRNLLVKLDLPFDAKEDDIKKKFRLLAKQYHPDTGDDPERFIELMNVYRKLLKNN